MRAHGDQQVLFYLLGSGHPSPATMVASQVVAEKSNSTTTVMRGGMLPRSVSYNYRATSTLAATDGGVRAIPPFVGQRTTTVRHEVASVVPGNLIGGNGQVRAPVDANIGAGREMRFYSGAGN